MTMKKQKAEAEMSNMVYDGLLNKVDTNQDMRAVNQGIGEVHQCVYEIPYEKMARQWVRCECGDRLWLHPNGWHCMRCGAWVPPPWVMI